MLLKLTRITGTLHEDLRTFKIISRWSLRMRNASEKIVEKIKIHILYSITFFQKLCCVWDNVQKCGRIRQATDDSIIQCMHIMCWITKVTDTFRVCNPYWTSTTTVVTQIPCYFMFICTLLVLFITYIVILHLYILRYMFMYSFFAMSHCPAMYNWAVYRWA